MTESARLSYGTRRWTAMSSGKSAGHARTEIATIGSGDAVASLSSVADVARITDARTSATNAAKALLSRGSADRWRRCGPPWWWIGADGKPGPINSTLRRSTTWWSAEAVTATAQPK